MTELTLLTKTYNVNQLKQIDRMLKLQFEGLDVEANVAAAAAGRWVQVALSGEDEAVATNYMRKEFGFCPASLENVKKYSTLKGYILNLGKSPDTLFVDVGVFQPQIVFATVPLRHLQAVLADGRKLALKKISELFGFCDDMPINVKVITLDTEKNIIEAELATGQLERFMAWQESLLDRLIVLGSSLKEVKRMLNYTGLDRDVISIEPLGMFEYALTCKLGTDAAGLISQVGRNLRNSRFVVFNPRKIKDILGLLKT
jgi:hypothetical protein